MFLISRLNLLSVLILLASDTILRSPPIKKLSIPKLIMCGELQEQVIL